MGHPHCYATEAFLYVYHHSKPEEYLQIVKKASYWLSKIQNKDGSLFRIYSVEKGITEQLKRLKTSDAIAQATRIWKLLGVNQQGIEKAYIYLNKQIEESGLRLSVMTHLQVEYFIGKGKFILGPHSSIFILLLCPLDGWITATSFSNRRVNYFNELKVGKWIIP